jgi:hypothetical protein
MGKQAFNTEQVAVGYVSVPTSPTSTGTTGQRAIDTTNKYVYECIATNTWVRYSYTNSFGQIVLTYASNGDTNGLLYYAGKNYTSGGTWTNPSTAGYIGVGGYNSSNTLVTAGAGAVDRSATDDTGVNTNAAGNYWLVTLPSGKAINPNGIWIRGRPAASGTASNIASYKIQGSNDGSTWTDIITISGLTYSSADDYKYNSFTAPGIYYRYIRLLWQSNVTNANSFFFLTDLELYGTLSF